MYVRWVVEIRVADSDAGSYTFLGINLDKKDFQNRFVQNSDFIFLKDVRNGIQAPDPSK